MEQPNYYSIIPANVRYDDNITPNAKLLYGEITSLCNEKGYCWATNSYFAKLYKCTQHAVSTWLSQLSKNGYINIEIKRKEGSYEIINRHISINQYPIDKIINTPIDNKVIENNTSMNNTSINNKEKFEQFWNVYPKKISKANALKSFEKIKCDDELLNIILSAIHTQSQSEQWQKDNGKYIPYPATWLNQHRWEDELSVSAKQGYTNSLADIDFSKIKNPFEEEI